MANFRYSGRDNAGTLVAGTMDASSAGEVAAALVSDQIIPVDIEILVTPQQKPTGARRSFDSKAQEGDGLWLQFRSLLGAQPVSIDELIIFSRQMFSLIKAGLPLDKALKGLEASVNNLAFKRVLNDIIVSLENGMDLATSLGRHPAVFSQLFVSLIHVGENTGRLDQAFSEIAKYLTLEQKTRKQVKKATRYPLFVLVSIAAALALITVFVIPVFSATFDRLGAQLPWQTRALIGLSDFAVAYWPVILLAVFGAIYGFRYYVSTTLGRLAWDKRKLTLPLAGTIFERVALGRFSRTFSMVMSSGVPIVQGLTVVSGAVGNAFVAHHVQKMREGVERGESLHRTAIVSGMFTPLVLQMISVGEETGTIDDLLNEVADFYDAEVEYDVTRLSDAIEPILISLIGGLVLVLALGVFLPIWDLNTAVQG
ncbi:MAG: type II secretion system F family protein [Gammaproteobacteria bacterium]|nr:type II secretion system F family protein [Gammaproteobacteria bacterium]